MKVISPSYIKRGKKSDPANYRGISLTSNLGKLFNEVLYARILKFLNLNKIIHENQIGFKEESRNTDHIFTLKSIIEIYESQKKKVFAAFIDLRKAFDTVWHKGLFYVLLKHNFSHKIFKMVHSMYQDTHCKIKFKTGISRDFISRDFVSTCGVKQGDVLSPILFNLYINSIVDDLEKAKTDPVIVGDVQVKSLLYADDIILLSSTQEGLQNSLNVSSNFCSSWKLDVSQEKSKAIVFNSNGKTYMNSFNLKGKHLETVKSYCYLGVTIKYTGNLNISSKLLMEKGRKAWFKIKKNVGLNNPCNLLEKLFDTLVVLIILYGCGIWGVDHYFKDSEPFEQLHIY